MSSINLNYQTLKTEIDKLNKKLSYKAEANDDGKKFSLLMLKKLSGYRGDRLLRCYTDGSGDHQIDGVYFYESGEELVINIISCVFLAKPRATFGDKDITDFIHNGICYLLFDGDKPQDINEKLKLIKEEINESKADYDGHYSVNIKLITSSDNVLQSTSRTQLSKFRNSILSSGVELEYEEINGQNASALFSSRTILKTSIPIKLSGHSYYPFTGIEGFICRLPAAELIKVYEGFEENERKYVGYKDSLFTDNIRKNLGLKRTINQKMYETATDESTAEYFEYYNNGLTIVYDDISGGIKGDSPIIHLKGLQIVNGCQTVNTLIKAHNERTLKDNIYLTCRFIKRTKNQDFIQSVITYTNSQNAISDRDLHSNDPIQYNIQTILGNCGIHYERKLNEFMEIEGPEEMVVDALEAAQAYLCCEFKKPHKAKQEKKKIFGQLYYEIFDQNRADLPFRLFLAHLVMGKVLSEQELRRKKKAKTKREGKTPKYKFEDLIVAHGSYHIAAKLYQKYFGGARVLNDLKSMTKSKKLPNKFDTDYKIIVAEISQLVNQEKIDRENLPKYFKSPESLSTIT